MNIAKFRVQQNDPVNKDFIDNLDLVNAAAERQPGFVWRFQGAENNAMDVQAFEDPNIIVNMSVWTNLQSFADFVYNAKEHKNIMKRRHEWFVKIDFHMVFWWIEEGTTPTIDEAKNRLEQLRKYGPTNLAFTFKNPVAMPSGHDAETVNN